MNWCHYDLVFVAQDAGRLPDFPGSMLRGALGHALKRLACVMRGQACGGCPLEHACLYTTVFETRPAPRSGIMRQYERAPHPFVLVVDFMRGARIAPGDRLCVGLRLFGSALNAAPFVLRALDEAAARGFGAGRLPFRLEVIRQDGQDGGWRPGEPYPAAMPLAAPPPAEGRLEWRVVTPLRLAVDGRPMTPERVRAGALAMGMLRRLGLMQAFFAPASPAPDFAGLKAQCDRLGLESVVEWRPLLRRSSRQRATQSIAGLIGTLRLDLREAPDWGGPLGWAPVLHLGKGTAMGLGRLVAA